MAEIAEATVAIQRVTVSTDRVFDDVVAAVYAGRGREQWAHRVPEPRSGGANHSAGPAVATSLDDAVVALLTTAAG